MGFPSSVRDRADKRSRSVESRRRATVYLMQLGWLEGFPDAGGWRRIDPGAKAEVLAIDGAVIARSRRAARTVLREHREVLASHVGDVDRWWAVVDAVLAWCSSSARGASPRRALFDRLLPHLPQRTARLARTHAHRPDVVAAVIAWVLQPDVLGLTLDWLVAHELDHDLPIMLALARLAVLDEAGVAALLALLETDVPDPQAAVDGVRALVNRLSGKPDKPGKLPAKPGRSTPRVLSWIARLARRDADHQRRALALVAVTDLAGALASWRAWEAEHEARCKRAAAFVSREFDRKREEKNLVALVVSLEGVIRQAPASYVIDDAFLELDMLASPAMAKFQPAIVRLLAAIPAELGPLARPRMLLHLARTAATAEHPRTTWLWDAIAGALEAGAPAALLALWHDTLASGRRQYVDDDLVERAKRRADVERLVGVLSELARNGKLSGDAAEDATEWIAAGLDDARVVELIAALPQLSGKISADHARATVAIADGTIADLAAQATALHLVTEPLPYQATRELLALIEHAARTGACWFVRDLIAAGQGTLLAQAAGMLALLPKPRWPALTMHTPSPWIARYPAVLAPALERLASVDPEAEHTASRRLATDLPDPAALAVEIAALRARTPLAPRLATRLANLEARLAAPKLPSPNRLARLAAKLERTASAIGLARFTALVTANATDRLVRTFGLGHWPDWPLDRRTQEILFGLLALDEPDRALAGRLLRARMGPPPWDLRDDPANRAFLDRMRARGLDPAAWLDDGVHVMEVPGAKPVELAMTSDPLEVFAMGAHFDTCLSPNSGNFFSVVANAADINKRVLYARRGSHVVGRCLLAITDTMALLTFQAYCHESIDFTKIVGRFVGELANRMHTKPVARGTVSTLLARDWYDDGARDLVGRFSALHDTARLDLETIDPAALITTLRDVLGHALDDMTLPIVLALPGLRSRPALVMPLVPALLASTATMPSTMITAAELALEAGDPALADRLLGPHAGAIRLAHHAWPWGAMLARLRPSVALARLRATRLRHVRRLADESGDRLAVAAVAMETLRRPRQAAALYKLAIERESYLADDLEIRLAAIGLR